MVENSYSLNKNLADSACRNDHVSGDQKILFKMFFDVDENNVDIDENEVCIHLSKCQSSAINVYYNSGILSQPKVEAFFDQFVEFITSLLEES